MFYIMRFTLSKLRDVGMLTNTGNIIDFSELNTKQSMCVINNVLQIINPKNDKDTRSLSELINQYLESDRCLGTYKNFPDVIVRQLLDQYKDKMIDLILLEDE